MTFDGTRVTVLVEQTLGHSRKHFDQRVVLVIHLFVVLCAVGKSEEKKQIRQSEEDLLDVILISN